MKKFEAIITKEKLSFIINAVEKLTKEFILQCKQDHIKINVVDPAHMAMMEAKVHKKYFEKYKSTEFDMGIDVDKLDSILLDEIDPETKITLKYLNDINKLMISYNGIVHRIKLIEVAGIPRGKKPNIAFSGSVDVFASDLKKSIKPLSKISDHLKLTLGADGFTAFAESDEDDVTIPFNHHNLEISKSYPKDSTMKSLFSTDYFDNVASPFKDSDFLSISMGDDNPIRIRTGNDNEIVKLEMLLAPRIESE